MLGFKKRDKAADHIAQELQTLSPLTKLNIEAAKLEELSPSQSKALYNVLKLAKENNVSGECSIGWLNIEFFNGQIHNLKTMMGDVK